MWIYSCDFETEQQSSHGMSPALPCPKRAWCVHSQVCCLLFGHQGIVHFEFAPEGQKRFLSGCPESFVGCSMKKATWNVEYWKLAPPAE
jgi:hypothetical protein